MSYKIKNNQNEFELRGEVVFDNIKKLAKNNKYTQNGLFKLVLENDEIKEKLKCYLEGIGIQ